MDGEQRAPRADWIDRLVTRTEGAVQVQLSAEVEVAFPVEVFDERGPGFVRRERYVSGMRSLHAQDVIRNVRLRPQFV
jgi:hypothetical protein